MLRYNFSCDESGGLTFNIIMKDGEIIEQNPVAHHIGKLPDGQIGLDYLYANVPADLLQTELDQCWVKYAGYEPVAYLEKYSGRSPVVHLKDFHVEGKQEGDPYALIGLNENEKKANTAFEFRPLGKGVQDIPAIIAASKAAGSKWLVVEQDQPSMGKNPLECAQMSIEYLKSL